MKVLLFLTALFLSSAGTVTNTPVERVDLQKYAGTWYSLYSIPTMFDRGSIETTGKYIWNNKGYFDVTTTCKKGDTKELKTVSSKVIPVAGTNNAQLKAQFIWPYKIDYWIIELADDYSYVVVGHPDHKFLFIMSRKKTMEPALYNAIITRCKARGYDVVKVESQHHKS